MSQGDQFHQYGYDHYLKAPRRQGTYRQNPYNYKSGGSGLISSLLYSVGASALFRRLQSPVIAGSVLAAAALLFVGVVALTYSSEDDADKAIPIVRADMDDIKYAPSNPGGMDIPNRQSTILARGDQPSAEDQANAVENLLAAQGQDDLISKEEAFNRATQIPMMGEDAGSFAGSAEAQDDLTALHAQAEGAIDVLSEIDAGESSSATVPAQSSIAPAFELEKPAANDILQKIGSSADDAEKTSSYSQEFLDKTAKAAVAAKPASPTTVSSTALLATPTQSASANAALASKPDPSSLHGAGQSPETLEYVRSVLENDNSYDTGGVQVDGQDVQSIEPAVGVPADVQPEPVLAGDAYFVQLASITDAKRAPEEWEKMQNKYSVLSSSRFRVQEATLPGGTFYRIQAGR